MRLAFQFTSRDSGVWSVETEKAIYGGSSAALLEFAKSCDLSGIELYGQPNNANPFILLKNEYPDLPFNVYVPVCVPVDPVQRLKTLFAVHFSGRIHNRPCRQLANSIEAWALAVPDLEPIQYARLVETHVAYPMLSFPHLADPVTAGRLLGEILTPLRFADSRNSWSRLTQSLQINNKTAKRFLAGELCADGTTWAYRSWGGGQAVSSADMQRPNAFLHRIASTSRHGIVTATKTWLHMLASYWSCLETDPHTKAKADRFLRKEAEKAALQQHLNSVIAGRPEV